MSFLALSARRGALPVRQTPALIAKRALGDGVRGPSVTDVAGNLKYAKEFFTKGAVSYAEFKQQCVSLRLFAVAGVTAGCALALVVDPPKSSYWAHLGPSSWWAGLKRTFWCSAPPLFLLERASHDTDVSEVVKELVFARFAKQISKPKVVFVLGGPGAGKGTQCGKIIDNYDSWAHISAGDCLRAERADPTSKDGELINKFIKEGKIVPVEITVKLLQKAMAAASEEGKNCFLIDGFPRNLDNVTGWEKVVGNKARVCGVLFYDASEAELEKRLLQRGTTSGRTDDNIESIKKRFRTYMTESMPIVQKYEEKGMVTKIDGMPPVENVWAITKKAIAEYEAM